MSDDNTDVYTSDVNTADSDVDHSTGHHADDVDTGISQLDYDIAQMHSNIAHRDDIESETGQSRNPNIVRRDRRGFRRRPSKDEDESTTSTGYGMIIYHLSDMSSLTSSSTAESSKTESSKTESLKTESLKTESLKTESPKMISSKRKSSKRESKSKRISSTIHHIPPTLPALTEQHLERTEHHIPPKSAFSCDSVADTLKSIAHRKKANFSFAIMENEEDIMEHIQQGTSSMGWDLNIFQNMKVNSNPRFFSLSFAFDFKIMISI